MLQLPGLLDSEPSRPWLRSPPHGAGNDGLDRGPLTHEKRDGCRTPPTRAGDSAASAGLRPAYLRFSPHAGEKSQQANHLTLVSAAFKLALGSVLACREGPGALGIEARRGGAAISRALLRGKSQRTGEGEKGGRGPSGCRLLARGRGRTTRGTQCRLRPRLPRRLQLRTAGALLSSRRLLGPVGPKATVTGGCRGRLQNKRLIPHKGGPRCGESWILQRSSAALPSAASLSSPGTVCPCRGKLNSLARVAAALRAAAAALTGHGGNPVAREGGAKQRMGARLEEN